VVLALALGLAMWGGMRAYSAPAAGSGWMAWDQATAVLDREMRLFVECFGVHPRRVDDMMSPHPQWGEDGSGNAVDLTGAAKKLGGKWRPLAPKDLPVDPATGSRHTWVVDPSAPMWLRSKGLRTTAVIQAPTPTRR
jgi:hypothetical protein